MRGAIKICNGVYWLALTIWIAALVSGGVAAAGVFSTLPKLGILIPKYQSALGNDTAEHGRVAGGMVMEPIFTAMDWVQATAAFFVVLTLVSQLTVFKMRLKSPGHLIRTICIGSAVLVMIVHMTALAPRMNRELRARWNAIEVSDRAAMETHRAAFESDHHLADSLYAARLILLLVGVAASGAALGSTKPDRSALEMPRLLRLG
jgi:hypothetical protein